MISFGLPPWYMYYVRMNCYFLTNRFFPNASTSTIYIIKTQVLLTSKAFHIHQFWDYTALTSVSYYFIRFADLIIHQPVSKCVSRVENVSGKLGHSKIFIEFSNSINICYILVLQVYTSISEQHWHTYRT